MKVQLQDQTLRVRIDEAELARLLDGAEVSNHTQWPDGVVECQRLALGATPGWQRESDGWRIVLNRAEVHAFASRLPSRDGLPITLAVPSGEPLQLLFDVDVRDSVRHRRHSKEGRA
ncbi:hypothetical protein [Dyella sp. ASV21]|uniref:hypothetical protein n=1 Tax=Dyella sp. ASV21 TaxID=2795114 RepID=UPI0018EC5393|nr:hypothetical protein [Dyella sp. ASV21]